MKININKVLFLISYILILIPFAFLQLNLDSTFLHLIYLLSIFILIFLFIYQNLIINKAINKKTLIFLIILFVLSVISSLCINNTIILRTFLFICAFRNIKFDEFIKWDAIIRICFVIILFILFNLNLTEPVEVLREGVSRFSFGFNHPNKFGLYIMLICIDLTYLYLKNKKRNLKWILFIFISILNFIVYYFASSRASFVIITGCLILLILDKKIIFKIINYKPIKFIIKNSYLILTILMVVLVFLHRNNNIIVDKIDEILSYRILWSSEYLEGYDINLFGHDIKFFETEKIVNTTRHLVLDNSYIFCLLNYGIVFVIIIVIGFKKLFTLLYNRKKYLYIIFMFMFLIYGLMETALVKFYSNPFLLLFNYLIFKDDDMF